MNEARDAVEQLRTEAVAALRKVGLNREATALAEAPAHHFLIKVIAADEALVEAMNKLEAARSVAIAAGLEVVKGDRINVLRGQLIDANGVMQRLTVELGAIIQRVLEGRDHA